MSFFQALGGKWRGGDPVAGTPNRPDAAAGFRARSQSADPCEGSLGISQFWGQKSAKKRGKCWESSGICGGMEGEVASHRLKKVKSDGMGRLGGPGCPGGILHCPT